MRSTARRLAWALGTLLICATAACSDDDSSGGSSGGSGGASSGQCLDLSGEWTMAQHCDPTQIGEVFTVAQSGCSLSVEPFGFKGSIDSDGAITMTGTAPGVGDLTCTGTATSDTIDEVCEPGGCVVQLTR